MINLIRNNQKKVLAVFTVLLTLTFVVSSGTGRNAPRGTGGEDRVVGTVRGGKDLRASEVNSAQAELAAVVQQYVDFQMPPVYRQQFGAALPVMDLLDVRPEIAVALRDRPELFALLRREAEAAGVRANPDEVSRRMVNNFPAVTAEADPDVYAATVRGVSDLLAIRQYFERVTDAVKVSRPAADNALVKGVSGGQGAEGAREQISLNVVNLAAADYLPTTPAPTTQQCQAQFDKYAAVTPDHPSADNPFGFGYKYPVRMTVQYVRLTPEAVEKAVEATRSAYDWEVAAREYYLSHPAEFRLTPGVTALGPAPATAPAGGGTRAFEAVKAEATKAVRDPLVATLAGQVRQFLTSRMLQDWQASQQGAGPAPYAAADYLHALAAEAGKRFQGVVVEVVDAPANLTQTQVDDLPGLLTLRSPDKQTLGGVLAQRAVDCLALKDQTTPAARAVLTRPSPVMTSMLYAEALPKGLDLGDGPVVIGRAVLALPSQPPPDLAAVRAAVEANCRTAAAYDRAKADADRLLAAANDGQLAVVAQAMGHLPDATTGLTYDGINTVPKLPQELTKQFVHAAFDRLLAGYAPSPTTRPNPATLIAMPEAARVSVAQLLFVTPGWAAQDLHTDRIAAAAAARRAAVIDVMAGWFDPAAIVRRLDYKPAKGAD